MKRIEATAYHEAGHAVAHILLGKAFQYVTIEPDEGDDSLGRCMRLNGRFGVRLSEDVYAGNGRARKWIEERAIISAAGYAAESIFTGGKPLVGASADFTRITELLSHLSPEPEELGAYLNWILLRTRNLLRVPHNWLAVEAIAKALLERRTLKYEEAKTVAGKAQLGDDLYLRMKEIAGAVKMSKKGSAK